MHPTFPREHPALCSAGSSPSKQAGAVIQQRPDRAHGTNMSTLTTTVLVHVSEKSKNKNMVKINILIDTKEITGNLSFN